MNIAFVYFDLDDTLLDHAYAERNALADVRDRYRAIFGALSVDELQEKYHAINVPLWRQYADGEIEKAILKQERFKQLLEAVDAPHADPALVSRYYLQRYAAHWRFIPGARESFEQIANHFPVGVLTNGFCEVQTKKLETFPILREQSDAIVLCEETGVLKPNPEAFAHATEEADVAPDEILYVGDSFRSDVQGGRDAGWQVAWYARRGTDGQPTDAYSFAFESWDTLRDHLL